MNKHPSNVSETAGNKPTSNATAFTLSGTVVDPFRTFTSALSNSETCPVHASNGTDWQDFIGTYSAGTLAQTTLLESSTGSWIDWSSGGDVQLEIAWLGSHGEDTDAHIASTSNPHGTTAAQVGADPTGTASAAVAAHVAAGNPHPQYFEDPSGTATVGQMIVQSSTGPKWVAYATALNCSVNPVVSGTTQYGNVLTCSTGTWAGFGSISYAYQWYNGATLLSGETANTYTSVIGDIGDTISCTVTATDTLTSASSDSNGIVVEDNILNTSEFYAPLTHSLVLTRGVGDPTYSRATTAWEFDNSGYLVELPSGVARSGGARLSPVCAWYDSAGTTNFPKGCNNGALKDTNDTTVVYQSDGHLTCGKTGSANLLAKTNHNGQACGVADLNGLMWEVSPGITCIAGTKAITGVTLSNPVNLLVAGHGRTTGEIVQVTAIVGTTQLNDKLYKLTVVDADHITLDGVDGTGMTAYTSGGTLIYGTFYALNTSYAAKDLTGGNTLTTDQWGATGAAAHSSAIAPTFRTDYPQNGFDRRFGKSTNQVLDAATSGDGWLRTGLGLPLSTGISDGTSGTNMFGNDYLYQYIRNELCLLSGASWDYGSPAGVWAANLYYARTSSNVFVGFRAASYLSSFTSVTGDENVRHTGGVGVCPELPAGYTGMDGYNVLGSNNYGNYTYSDGSVMVWISVHYRKYNSDNTVDIRPYSYFADLATAIASGYTIDREFYDAGLLQPGYFIDKYKCSNNSGTASSIKYGNPLSTNSAHNPISGLTGAPTNNYSGCIAAAKTRGAQFFPAMAYHRAGLAMLSLWQGQYAATLANTTGNKGYQWSNIANDGSAIPAASLLGYHAEGARTNSLLYSRNMTNAAWAQTVTSGSELVTNGGFDADTNWTKTAAEITIGAGVASFAAVANGQYILATAPFLTVGKEYIVTYTVASISGGAFRAVLGTAACTDRSTTGTFTQSIVCTADTAFFIRAVGATTGTIDNVSVKEAAIQVSTCTGIDNAANSASTLTAGAANATILQTLTLASAARSTSAYVKRRTGTGTISFTRNGGTTWTDITSLINSSTWTRVKIENSSVTNPSVGFLIATSGDAIDVDIATDEAGAFISSPIVTTTAAVTRNADVLSYPTASNMLATAGAIRMQFTPTHAPSGTIVLAGTYVDSSNYTQLLHDGTNLVFRKRIAGTNYDATKAMAFIADTDYLIAATWGASGTQVCVDGVLGTAHANTTNAQIGSTYQIGADGNSGQQAVAYIAQHHIWQSALSDVELQQATTP